MDSVLAYLPPTGDRKSYRLQASIGLAEAAELEKLLVAEDLPFQGDMSCLIRTLLCHGIAALYAEQSQSNGYLQSLKHVLGSELLKWSSHACDSFATSSTDHLLLALDSGDVQRGFEIFNQVVDVVENATHKNVRAMLLHRLDMRGFTKSCARLRESLIDADINVYQFDTTFAEVFN